NFISRMKYTRELLKALVPLRRAGELGEWSAETTLNVASDEELLDLFAQAGCSTLIIGFESVNEATLVDMDKKVNFILSYEEAYAGTAGLDRLERYWRKYGRRHSSLLERAYIRYRLRRARGRSERMDWVLREGWSRLGRPGLRTDVGQLLYYFDSADFVDYL